MEFRVCFAMAMYENDMFLLCETSNASIGAFCYSKIHFHLSGPFKSIKTVLKSLQSISKSFERCLIASIDKGIYSDTVTSYLKHENRYFGFTCVYFECKNKFYTTLINGNVTWM